MSFIVSDGALLGLSKPAQALPTTLNLDTPVTFANASAVDYYEMFRKQRAVRTVVSFLGRNIGQLGIHAYRRKGDTDRERLGLDHPLARVMAKPNAVTTKYRFMDALVHDLGIYDRAYALKLGSSAQPQLVRVPPALVTPKGENWMTPDSFELKGSKGKQIVGREQLIYFRGYGGSADFGESPLESLRQILAEEHLSSKARSEVLNKGARVSGYIERPPSSQAGTWSETARTRFKNTWDSQYIGTGPGVGGTPILEDGMKFVDAHQSSRDLQYIEGRKLTREEVAAAYFIPPPMVGILDKATFSNITEQHKMLYQDTLGPWLTMIVEEIALQLIPDIAPTEMDELYVEFNLREKLSGNFEQRAASVMAAVGGPYMTINEARALDNRPPIDGGDELIRPLNVTQNGNQAPIPAEGAPAPDDEPAEDVDTDQEDE
ncbi:phage portal protein [Williamsia soli]|uniref:phage portal protein n=1 Tax=Williamsia soli TaxID=364929 RepID=UPI001A9F0C00|nr:phage portal protein [Williamsia soli]